MFQPNLDYEKALQFSRFDEEHPLSTCSAHGFQLEDREWPSAEHYYQWAKFAGTAYAQRILEANSGEEAHRLGNRWFKRKRPDFAKVRVLLMTRALYCKANQNPEIEAYLLDTADQLLAETSQYDHYWGIARDLRGENRMGKIWMDIRQRLQQPPQGSR